MRWAGPARKAARVASERKPAPCVRSSLGTWRAFSPDAKDRVCRILHQSNRIAQETLVTTEKQGLASELCEKVIAHAPIQSTPRTSPQSTVPQFPEQACELLPRCAILVSVRTNARPRRTGP